jgi:hypothetical protein
VHVGVVNGGVVNGGVVNGGVVNGGVVNGGARWCCTLVYVSASEIEMTSILALGHADAGWCASSAGAIIE